MLHWFYQPFFQLQLLADNRVGVNKIICFQPPCGAFILICLRTWEDHVFSLDTWLVPSTSLSKFKALNLVIIALTLGQQDTMFPFLLTCRPLRLLQQLVLCQPSQLPWIDCRSRFFWKFVFLPLLSRWRLQLLFPFSRDQGTHAAFCLSFFIPLRLLLILKT